MAVQLDNEAYFKKKRKENPYIKITRLQEIDTIIIFAIDSYVVHLINS